jgi:hypothetical protein
MLSGLIRQGIVQDGLNPLVHIGLKYDKRKRHRLGCLRRCYTNDTLMFFKDASTEPRLTGVLASTLIVISIWALNPLSLV